MPRSSPVSDEVNIFGLTTVKEAFPIGIPDGDSNSPIRLRITPLVIGYEQEHGQIAELETDDLRLVAVQDVGCGGIQFVIRRNEIIQLSDNLAAVGILG